VGGCGSPWGIFTTLTGSVVGNRRSWSLRESPAFPSRFPGRPAPTTEICFRTRVDLLDRWLNFCRISSTPDRSGEADGSREGTPAWLSSLCSCRIQVDSTCDISSIRTTYPYIPLLFAHHIPRVVHLALRGPGGGTYFSSANSLFSTRSWLLG